MNIRSRQLYAHMVEEIGQAEACCNDDLSRVERCFSIALSYWEKVKSISGSYPFRYEAEEIDFFKYVQPLFLAAMEYYMLIYQAILFKPAHDSDELLSYWLGQLKRIELFYTRHGEFYSYYLNGGSDKDECYFRRRENNSVCQGSHFAHTGRLSSPGLLAARILGFRRYQSYIESELKKIAEATTINFSHPERACA